MKKFLSLALVLMLALSLTAALADPINNTSGSATDVSLTVNVAPSTDTNDVDIPTTWNIDIDAAALNWNLDQEDKMEGDLVWTNDAYDDSGLTHTYTTTLRTGEVADKTVNVENHSNFDVDCAPALYPAKGFSNDALELTAGNGTTRLALGEDVDITVTIDVDSVDDDPITTGSAGKITLTFTKNGNEYAYNP